MDVSPDLYKNIRITCVSIFKKYNLISNLFEKLK